MMEINEKPTTKQIYIDELACSDGASHMYTINIYKYFNIMNYLCNNKLNIYMNDE